MATEPLQTRIKQATKAFGQLVNHYGTDEKELVTVSELLDITPRVVRYQYNRCKDKKDISGELLGRMLCLVEKSQAFGLKIEDRDLFEHTSVLLERARNELEAELKEEYFERQQALDEREQTLNELDGEMNLRETALATDRKQLESGRQELHHAFEERLNAVEELERKAKSQMAGLAAREKQVADREKRSSKWEVIRREFEPGGLLQRDHEKSVTRAELEFREAHYNEHGGWYGYGAEDSRIELELKERTFNTVVGPLRAIIYKIIER